MVLPCVCLLLAVSAASEPGTDSRPLTAPMPLSSVKTFMYQLQNIENPAALAQLANSNYDLLVVEPTALVTGNAGFDMKAMLAKLRAGKPNRIVLAYLDAAQAESFRTYWQRSWKAPTKTARAWPDFILTPDPDGWSGDYTVAYWDPRWQAIFVTNPDSQIHQVMRAGFDGVYLDWIDAWNDDAAVAEARRQKIDPAKSMVDFLLLIRKEARAINPRALVIQQNAFTLIDADPRLADAIDGLGVEDTWYSGAPNARWTSTRAGDIPNKDSDESSTAARLAQYQKFLVAGKPVFNIDYCVNPAHAASVYAEARKHGLIPLVTRVSLDHLTTTPPP
jgi:cysteinyl-tRNA synthetase, unknown class